MLILVKGGKMIRNDFVSNSSSSSFILGNCRLWKNITKDDINEALIDLVYGSKEEHDKACEAEISELKKIENIDKWWYNYKRRELRKIKKHPDIYHSLYTIHDLSIDEDCNDIERNHKKHYKQWIAPNGTDPIKKKSFDDFCELMDHGLGCYEFRYYCGPIKNNEKIKYRTGKRKSDNSIEFKQVPKCFIDTYNRLWKLLGMKNMWDVIVSGESRYVIHFSENEVYRIKDMTTRTSSKYKSEYYTVERFCEILINYFVKKGKIKLDDPNLMEYWKVPNNHWWKRDEKYKHRKYFCDSDEKLTPYEIAKEMIRPNGILHEG